MKRITQDEFNKMAEDYQLYLWGRGGKKCDFSNMDLSGLVISNVNLSYINAYRAKFIGAKLSNVILIGADLVRCDFSSSTCNRVVFRNADLSNAKFVDSRISYTDFTGSKLTGAIGIKK